MDVIANTSDHNPNSSTRSGGEGGGQSDSDNDEVTDFLDLNEAPLTSTTEVATTPSDVTRPLRESSENVSEMLDDQKSPFYSQASVASIATVACEEKLDTSSSLTTSPVLNKYNHYLDGTISDLQNLRKYLVKRKNTIYPEANSVISNHHLLQPSITDPDNGAELDEYEGNRLLSGRQNGGNLSISLPDLNAPHLMTARCRSLVSSAGFQSISNYGLANFINLVGVSGCCMPTWPPIYQQRQQQQQQQQNRHRQHCFLNSLLFKEDDDRRKSWTGISQLTKTIIATPLAKDVDESVLMANKKSHSLSSLDSEERAATNPTTNGATLVTNASNSSLRATEQRKSRA